jgi:hypothetical protein
MRIAIFGTGGAGGYFGAQLAVIVHAAHHHGHVSAPVCEADVLEAGERAGEQEVGDRPCSVFRNFRPELRSPRYRGRFRQPTGR